MKIVNTHRAITPKVGKPELGKFHENVSGRFKVMERTRKLLTHKGQ